MCVCVVCVRVVCVRACGVYVCVGVWVAGGGTNQGRLTEGEGPVWLSSLY
jgi:hypothetical protein